MNKISRKEFLKTSALFASFFAIPKSMYGFNRFQDCGTFTILRDGAGFYTHQGGTIGFLVTPDASVAIDTQFPDMANAFIEGMKERSVSKLDVLVNTHHHGDHTGGNNELSVFASLHVAHKNVPLLMKEFAGDRKIPALPTTLYTDSWKKDIGKEVLHLYYFGSAHTKGDSIVVLENANIVHMGDVVFNRVHPFIDRPAGADIQNWISVLDSTLKLMDKDTIYIFGHGNPEYGVTGNSDDLRHKKAYLNAVLETAQKAINAGESKEEITKRESISGFEEHISFGVRLSPGFVLGVAYDELISEE